MWMKWQLWYNVAWYRCELKIQIVWDIVHKTNRFNRKKLHVPPRTVGITAGYVQYIIHTGLCRVCWLQVCVHWAVWVKEWAKLQAAKYGFWTTMETYNFSLLWNVQTGSGTTQPFIQRVWGFFPGGKVAKVRNEWSCTSAPPICLHGMDKTAFLNTGCHSGRL